MSQTKKASPAKAIFFLLIAVICIASIAYNWYHNVVPVKEECDRVAEETRVWNREHAGEPGTYVKVPTC